MNYLITPGKFSEIDQSFFDNLIRDGIEESIYLDYKETIIHNKKIAKHLSAFANTNGGNLIFGIKEDHHKPFKIIPITDSGARERINNVALTGIDPPLNIRILPVDVKVNGISGQVFIVFIRKSYPKLHMVLSTSKYYKRSEFASIPMTETEIRQAYFLLKQNKESREKILEERLKKFEGESHIYTGPFQGDYILTTTFTVDPINVFESLFEINEDMTKFLRKNNPFNASKTAHIFDPSPKFSSPKLRQNEFAFFSMEYIKTPLRSALIRTDGMIFYILKSHRKARPLDQETIDEASLPIVEIFDYFYGFLDFLKKFYKKVNYYGDLSISVDMFNLDHWKFPYSPFDFGQIHLEEIKIEIDSEIVSRNKRDVLEKLFNPVLRCYGHTDKMIYEEFEGSL